MYIFWRTCLTCIETVELQLVHSCTLHLLKVLSNISCELHIEAPLPILLYQYPSYVYSGFANFIDECRSQYDFCFTNFGVILEYLELSITMKKAIFRLSSTWSWHVYTIVRDTRSSCGGPLTWKAQIPDGGHRVNFDRNLPSGVKVAPCLLPKISGVEVTPSVTSVESSEQFWRKNTPNLAYLRTL